MKKLQMIIVILVLVITPTVSFALSITNEVKAKLNIEAGLDDQTRALIQGMPKEVREQIIIGLREALPLIDLSVSKYMADVDKIITKQLASIDCSIEGAAKTTVEELIAGFKFWKDGPNMVEDLRARARKLPDRFRWKSTPEDYRIFYGDALKAARSVACANKDTSTSYQEVMVIRNRLTNDVLPFERLRDNKCKTPEECVNSVKGIINEELKKADQRDVLSSNAITRLNSIKAPKRHNFDQPKYLISLKELFVIRDEVSLLSAIRVARFEIELETGNNKKFDFKSKLDVAKSASRDDYNSQSTALFTLNSLTEGERYAALKALDNAIELMPIHESEISTAKSEISQTFDEIRTLIPQLSSRINELRRSMEESCEDPCNGSKNQFCPRYKRAKPSDCR